MADNNNLTDNVQFVSSMICKSLPEGYMLNLCHEHGAAWVSLYKGGDPIDLPDRADKTLLEQIADAIGAAVTHQILER